MSPSELPSRREVLARAVRFGTGAAILSEWTGPLVGRSAAEQPGGKGKAASGASAKSPQGTYATINSQTWESILSDRDRRCRPPLTVHLPIQPLHSRDLIHVDCALNVCRRRVFPSPVDSASLRAAQEHETFALQFALGDPPLIPAGSASRLSLAEGKYPLAHAVYRLRDLLYEFDYFSCQADGRQNVLWVCVDVTNETPQTRTAHVRAKINFQRECDLFDYHYQPFRWDKTKWKPCRKVSLKENAIWRESTAVGRIVPGDFMVCWETSARFPEDQFKKELAGEAACHQNPALWLTAVEDALHFSAELRAKERRTFAVALVTDFEEATPADRKVLAAAAPAECRKRALRHFQSPFTPDSTHLVCPADDWDKIFTALQVSTLQLLVELPGRQGLMPVQGGSSERHYVWIWEAAMMLMPMLRLGHFRPVRRVLDYLFSFQDAGFPPSGRLASTAGAIGTPGTRWLSQTGSALALAAEYCRLAHDEDFLREGLPRIVKAAGWIVGEVRATRKLNPDGSRPPQYGLMPFGCGTDGDVGYVVTLTDAYTFWGLEKAVVLLEGLRDPRAPEFRKELEAYRADLAQTIARLTRSDGYIERTIATGKEGHQYPPFENTTSAVHLAFTGNLDIHSDRFRRFLAFVETRMMDGYFTGKMNADVFYMGVGEFAWHHTYLRLGQWKKAFAALRTNLRYSMTQDTWQVQERISVSNPAFTPWQPNGSGNGRTLEMMLNSLYFEHDGLVTLLGGIPFAWLAQNGVTALKNLHAQRGPISLEARMRDAQTCRLRVWSARAEAVPPVMHLPDHFALECDPAQAALEAGGIIRPRGKLRELTLLLRRGVP